MKQYSSADAPLYSNLSSRVWTIVFVTLATAVLGYAFVQALNSSSPMALALPALLVVALLWSRMTERHLPAVLNLLFFLLPFQQSLTGESTVNSSISISPADFIALLLALALPMMILRNGGLRTGPVGLPLFIFLSVATISSITYWDGINTANSLFRMFVITLVAVLIFANSPMKTQTAHRCFWAYLVAINVLSIASIISFIAGGFLSAQSTFGINKNALGPTFGCGVVIALAYVVTSALTPRQRVWLIASLIGASAGLILSLSRGGWIATGVGVLLVLLMTRNFKAFFASLLVLGTVVAIVWHALPDEARTYAVNISSRSSNIASRLVSIDDVMRAYHTSPLIGVGVGLRKHQEPHNVLVLTLGETGIIGLLAFIGMFVSGFYTFHLAARATRDDPRAWPIIVIGAAVLLVSLTHGLMDVYWRRGVGFMGWSSVGIAASLIVQKRRERVVAQAYPGLDTLPPL